MQDLFGSVRRSIVFRPTAVDGDGGFGGGGDEGTLVDKIIRKSRVFSKLSPPRPMLQQPTTSCGNAPAGAPAIRWRRGELIGTGAFGQVYMGMNLDSGELLAVKQVSIPANNASKEKAQIHIRELEEEVKLLKNLSHPNIVRYLGTVREEETMNILLEFVPGGSIASLLGKFGSFPESVIKMYTKQLLLGLDYLHKNGIMHRDIKGANILVDNRGCIKLADFGASKQVVELATVSGARSMKGTPYWMAPEVIRQTGHNFSADIWSVGCTVIEMATGKPPWSQQYKEIAAFFFHVGRTMEHPPIPDHLSAEAKHFLSKCLQKEPGLRPSAFELLQHPFVNGELLQSPVAINTAVTENSEEKPLSSRGDNLRDMAGSVDACNLGTLDFSIVTPEKLSVGKDIWGQDSVDDDMCCFEEKDELISAAEAKYSNLVGAEDPIKSFNPMREPDDWRCKYETSPEADEKNVGKEMECRGNAAAFETGSTEERKNDSSIFRQTSLDDDEEATEAKIQAFLHEKVLELKKLQSPLYEEYYNSFNPLCSPSISEVTGDQNASKYLKLPPKSRSPSRTPSRAVEGADDASPASSSRRVSHVGVGSSETCEQNLSPQANDLNDSQNTSSPTVPVFEIQKKWKEELDKELEIKREMMRQAGGAAKTSSPNDRGLSRQRERSRFASPSK